MNNQLSCNRNHGWFKYSIQITKSPENRLEAIVDVGPTKEGVNDVKTADGIDWHLNLKDPPNPIEIEKLYQYTRKAFFSIGPSSTSETRRTILGELRSDEKWDQEHNESKSIRVQIVLPTAQPLILIFKLLETKPSEPPRQAIINQIHDVYGEDDPYKNLGELKSDAKYVLDIPSEVLLINKLGIISGQYKQNFQNRAESFIANRMIGRPRKERCIGNRKTYETIVNQFNSDEFPGLPKVDPKQIEAKYIERYFKSDSPQTDPKTYGIDLSGLSQIENVFLLKNVADDIYNDGSSEVKRRLKKEFGSEIQKQDRESERWYRENKENGQDSNKQPAERAKAWKGIIRYAVAKDVDEFEFVFANYLYWRAITERPTPKCSERLFAAAAMLFDSEHQNNPIFHRKCMIFRYKELATLYRFGKSEFSRNEEYRKAESYYNKAYELAISRTDSFNPEYIFAATLRRDAAIMAVRRNSRNHSYSEAKIELEKAEAEISECLSHSSSNQLHKKIKKHLEAERKSIEGHEFWDSGRSRAAGKRFWEARQLYQDINKYHSLAKIEDLIERILRESVASGKYGESDAKIKENVRDAYHQACAICGARRCAPNGNFEVEVAHIDPKNEGDSEGGPYVLENLLPLCRFHHWAFDNNWLYIEDDYTVCVAQEPNIPGYEELKDINGSDLNRPRDEIFPLPHPLFMAARRRLNPYADDKPLTEIDIQPPTNEYDALESDIVHP